MVRAGDSFYPSHFPQRMEDSLGVIRLGVPPMAGPVAGAVGGPQMALGGVGSQSPMDQGERSSSTGSEGSITRDGRVREGGSSGRDELGSNDPRDRGDEAEGRTSPRNGASECSGTVRQGIPYVSKGDASAAVDGIAWKRSVRQQRESAIREVGVPEESPVESKGIKGSRGKKRERSASESE